MVSDLCEIHFSPIPKQYCWGKDLHGMLEQLWCNTYGVIQTLSGCKHFCSLWISTSVFNYSLSGDGVCILHINTSSVQVGRCLSRTPCNLCGSCFLNNMKAKLNTTQSKLCAGGEDNEITTYYTYTHVCTHNIILSFTHRPPHPSRLHGLTFLLTYITTGPHWHQNSFWREN